MYAPANNLPLVSREWRNDGKENNNRHNGESCGKEVQNELEDDNETRTAYRFIYGTAKKVATAMLLGVIGTTIPSPLANLRGKFKNPLNELPLEFQQQVNVSCSRLDLQSRHGLKPMCRICFLKFDGTARLRQTMLQLGFG